MPFVSQRQRAWMHANNPKMAAEWEAATPKGASLPVRAHPAKKGRHEHGKLVGEPVMKRQR